MCIIQILESSNTIDIANDFVLLNLQNPTNRFICISTRTCCNLQLIIDRVHTNLHRIYCTRGKYEVWIFRKIAPMEAAVQRKMYFVFR